jgi:hypothetical protein
MCRPAAPRPASGEPEFVPLPDRWSIPYPDSPRLVKGGGLDPYNQNVLKGDRPVIGDSVFFVLGATLDLPLEVRGLPVGSGVSTANPQSLEFFGSGGQLFTSPRAFVSAELFHGQTAFRPRSWALKVTGAFDLNYLRVEEQNVVNPDPREGRTRRREDLALEEAYGELKLKDLGRPTTSSPSAPASSPSCPTSAASCSATRISAHGSSATLRRTAGSTNAAFFDLLEKRDQQRMLKTLREARAAGRGGEPLPAGLLCANGYTLSLRYHWSA